MTILEKPFIFSLLILYYLLVIIIISEFLGYLWHRYGAHTDVIPGVHNTHRIHHEADLSHQAHEDFYWILFILLVLGIIIFNVYYFNLLNNAINADILSNLWLIIGGGYIILSTVLIGNWYVHAAYHISDHWLNNYNWFREDKKIHLQHHINPQVNYGIASHFSDVIFGTYEYPYGSSHQYP